MDYFLIERTQYLTTSTRWWTGNLVRGAKKVAHQFSAQTVFKHKEDPRKKIKGWFPHFFVTITNDQATYLLLGNLLQFLDNIFDKIMHWEKNSTSIKLASLKSWRMHQLLKRQELLVNFTPRRSPRCSRRRRIFTKALKVSSFPD